MRRDTRTRGRGGLGRRREERRIVVREGEKESHTRGNGGEGREEREKGGKARKKEGGNEKGEKG